MKRPRNVNWLDLADRVDPDMSAVAIIAKGEVSVCDAYGTDDDGVNLIYDEETDTVFRIVGEPWPPTYEVAKTLNQYKPGEL